MTPPTVAICAVARNESPYIAEWVAFHFLQGVAAIRVYDHASTDNTRALLAEMAAHVPVTVADWPQPGLEYFAGQCACYLDGARYFAGRVDFVAFIDIDEFIHGSTGASLRDEAGRFAPEVAAVGLANRLFGSSGHLRYSPEPVIARFTRCAPPDHPSGRWFKTMARPGLIAEFDSAHSVKLTSGRYVQADHEAMRCSGAHPGQADRVGHGAIRLRHYMLKSAEEYRWKHQRFDHSGHKPRYDTAFFAERERFANAVLADDLGREAAAVQRMIAQWRLSSPSLSPSRPDGP